MYKNNMVDERFELMALVFRLVGGRLDYNDENTDYQKELASGFEKFKNHPAVEYVRENLHYIGHDAVFLYSVHIAKENGKFALMPNLDCLIDDGRWNEKSSAEFLELLNKFYIDTDFESFYQSHISFYKAQTQAFVETTYSKIDFEWFRTYINPNNLRCIYTPAISYANNAARLKSDDEIIGYAMVVNKGGALVHEFCHFFANQIAEKWYNENPEFKKWCEDSIDSSSPYIRAGGNASIIAYEYVTRAYNTLYEAEHGRSPLLSLIVEKSYGLPYMEDVYAMITPYEKPAVMINNENDRIKRIEDILGVKIEMGDEQSYELKDGTAHWKCLNLSEPLPSYSYMPATVGNIYNTKTDDIILADDSDLLIDLGEAEFQGRKGFRYYFKIALE